MERGMIDLIKSFDEDLQGAVDVDKYFNEAKDAPFQLPAGRGGLSGPGSRWLRGPGLRPVGAPRPLLSCAS